MALGDVIARLAVSLSLETAALEKGATLAEKRMNQAAKRFESIGKRMSGIGQKMSLAITAPLAAFGYSAVNAASDAQELQSAFDVTFGQMSATMNKWAEDTGNAMGRSTQEMQKAANTFGIFFNTAVDPAKAAQMSQVFAELAQDLGSFFNTDTQTAIDKLRSGLSGESEPLRDFGVFLTEANVKAKALELGLTGVGNELTEQEKILARYQIILESTTAAQGDVARTSDSTSNRMRAAKAQYEELSVSLGEKLLPVVNKFLGLAEKVLNWFNSLSPSVQTAIVAVAGIAAVLGPVLVLFGSLVSVGGPLLAFLGALGPVISIVAKSLLLIAANPVILGLAAVIAGIYLAWKNWDKIEAIVSKLYKGVKTWILDKLGAVWDWVIDKIKAVGAVFAWLFDAVVGHSYIPDMVDGIASEMKRLDTVMVAPVEKATSKAAQAFANMAQETRTILDRLFPETAASLTYEAERALLSKTLSGAALQQALIALASERAAALQANRPTVDFGDRGGSLDQGIKNTIESIEKLTEKAKTSTVRIAKSFKDMADDTLASLSRLTSAIKGGGFLGILDAVIGLGLQLGSIGVFGSKVANRINKVPAYANGTSFHPGGLALVGERGPELVSMPRGSAVRSNGDWGTSRVEVIPSPYFDVVVDGRIIQAAPAIASAGAQGGVSRMAYRQTRRL